jgi:hypothetical protein
MHAIGRACSRGAAVATHTLSSNTAASHSATLVRTAPQACIPRGHTASHLPCVRAASRHGTCVGSLNTSRGDVAWLAFAGRGVRAGAVRASQHGNFEEFISGGGVGMEARTLVAYCFSVSDDFRFASAQRAITQAYSAPARIFFNEVMHISVPSDAVPTWPSEAVEQLGNDESPSETREAAGAGASGSNADNPAADGGEGARPSDCDVFLFRDGSLVLWGMDADAEHGANSQKSKLHKWLYSKYTRALTFEGL